MCNLLIINDGSFTVISTAPLLSFRPEWRNLISACHLSAMGLQTDFKVEGKVVGEDVGGDVGAEGGGELIGGTETGGDNLYVAGALKHHDIVNTDPGLV